MDERQFFTEKPEQRPARFQCPRCRRTNDYSIRWLRRTKKSQIPPGANERDRALFGKSKDHLIRVDDANNVIAFRRWSDDAPDQQVVVMANFHRNHRENFVFGFPHAGAWKLRLNTDWKGYSALFGDYPSTDVIAKPGDYDGLPNHAAVSIGPYSVLVYTYTGSVPLRTAP